MKYAVFISVEDAWIAISQNSAWKPHNIRKSTHAAQTTTLPVYLWRHPQTPTGCTAGCALQTNRNLTRQFGLTRQNTHSSLAFEIPVVFTYAAVSTTPLPALASAHFRPKSSAPRIAASLHLYPERHWARRKSGLTHNRNHKPEIASSLRSCPGNPWALRRNDPGHFIATTAQRRTDDCSVRAFP